MRQQLDEADEEISREKALRREVSNNALSAGGEVSHDQTTPTPESPPSICLPHVVNWQVATPVTFPLVLSYNVGNMMIV